MKTWLAIPLFLAALTGEDAVPPAAGDPASRPPAESAALTGDEAVPPAAGESAPSAPAPTATPAPTPAPHQAARRETPPIRVAGAGPELGEFRQWKGRPKEPFTEPEKSFRAAFDALKEKYVDAGLTDADLWRAATAGMLQNAGGRPYDELLSPAEMSEIHGHLGGEIVGIGVEIHFDDDTGMAIVRGVLPGGAAEKAGLEAGDAILKVDGKAFRGKQVRDIVYAIRGKEGEPVTLSLLREANVVTKTLKRTRVVIQSVTAEVLPDDVGLLTITSFNKKTPALLESALGRLEKDKVTALVVDLRDCPGGHFEKVLEGAGLLLPEGATIVTAVHRGGAEEAYKAKGGTPLDRVPVAVIVNEKTASGGEILAGALQEQGAVVIGKKTHGKWNVQMIEPLPNDYAIKFTTAVFKSAGGELLDGVGLLPDIEVEMDEEAHKAAVRATTPDARIAADPQLRVAVNALRR